MSFSRPFPRHQRLLPRRGRGEDDLLDHRVLLEVAFDGAQPHGELALPRIADEVDGGDQKEEADYAPCLINSIAALDLAINDPS